jgi:hypothetical protein
MKILIFDHNCVCLFLREKMQLAKDIDDADVVVLWQDVLGIEKGVAELAHLKGKKVIVLQHGRNATVDYANYPLLADKICVWGTNDVARMKEYGIPDSKVALTGTDVLFHTKPRQKHEGINVTFRPIHWDTAYVEENIILRDALRNIKGINVTTKLTEAHDQKILTTLSVLIGIILTILIYALMSLPVLMLLLGLEKMVPLR